jgi:hypothetical protein
MDVIAPPRGIYVIFGRFAGLPGPNMWGLPHISGVWFQRNWALVEATQGVYDWSLYDGIVNNAQAYGKTVILGLHQGLLNDGMPRWATFPLFTTGGMVSGLIPWDPSYLDAFGAVTAALVERYAAHPNVAGFTLGGYYNWNTDDFDLANSNVADRQSWIARGYTRSKISASMRYFLRLLSTRTAKAIRVASAAPMINETNASQDVASTREYQAETLLRDLHQQAKFAGAVNLTDIDGLGWQSLSSINQVLIGRTIFSHTTADPLGIWNQTPINTQFQMILDYAPNVWGQRLPSEQGGPSTVDDWTRAADIALHYGLQFFEISPSQANNPALYGVWEPFQDALLHGGGHIGH